MIIIKKEKNKEKKATGGCTNPYHYAKKAYEKEKEPDFAEEDATIGCEDDPKREEKKKREKKEVTAYSSALRILQSGANSSKMLREKLLRKGFSQDEVENAVFEMQKASFINDRRLLLGHAEFLAKRKYYGKSRIRMELYQKFDKEIVAESFEEAVAELDFVALARQLALKTKAKSKSALVGKLKRNGFTAYEVRAALDALPRGEWEADDAEEGFPDD